MPKGFVTTARGENLNLDELIAKSRRPPGLKEANSEIKKRPDPAKRKPINVRGFQPAQGTAQVRRPEHVERKEEAIEDTVPVSEVKNETPLADLTNIKVEKKPTTKKPDGSATEAASETLNEIMGDLKPNQAQYDAAAKQVEEEETRGVRRRKKT